MKRTCPPRLSCGSWLIVILSCLGLGHLLAEEFTQKPSVAPSEVRQTAPTEKKTDAPKSEPEPDLKITGPKPEWIWGPDANKTYTLSKEFDADAKTAILIASCDNQMDVLLNGKRVAASSNWEAPVVVNVHKDLRPGKNVLSAKVQNQGGPSGFVAKLILKGANGKPRYILTDKTWQAKSGEETVAVKTLGKLGKAPWGDVFSQPANANLPGAPRDVFQVLPGFQVELLYSVPKDEQGSWVSLTTDDKGRLIASDQGNKGLYRITPPAIGSNEPTRVEHLDVKISAAQGMLVAFGSLYVSVNGGPGSGLYRARDTNGDDQYDEVTKLKSIRGGGEHGPHARKAVARWQVDLPDRREPHQAAREFRCQPAAPQLVRRFAPAPPMGRPRSRPRHPRSRRLDRQDRSRR